MNKVEAKKVFGENLKKLRLARNMSQEELAKALGYTNRSSINKIELGKNDMPRSKVARAAQVLGVSPLKLFEVCDLEVLSFNDDLEKDITALIETVASKPLSDLDENRSQLMEGPYIVEFPEVDAKTRKLMKLIRELSPEGVSEILTFAEYVMSKQEKEKNE